jgi:RNA recognition motif-containing protein
VSEEDLKAHFEDIGHIDSCHLECDDDESEECCGYCEFDNDQEVQDAIDEFDNTEFWGHTIRVSRAH